MYNFCVWFVSENMITRLESVSSAHTRGKGEKNQKGNLYCIDQIRIQARCYRLFFTSLLDVFSSVITQLKVAVKLLMDSFLKHTFTR